MRSETGRVSVVLAESGKAVGGTERVVWELATRLPKSRFDVQVWLSPAPEVDEFAAALERGDTVVRRLAEIDSRWDWRGMAATWQALRKARPELLHIHHVWPAADRYLSSLAAAAGVPRQVVTEHIVGRSHSAGQSALKRAELARVDAITTVCGAVAESLVRDYGVARERLRVVPNGADLPDEDAEEAPARRFRDAFGAGFMRPLWVCAARLEEQKGHDVLLDALAEVRRRGLEFVAAFAGEGSLRAPLERRAAELGLTQQVHFLGQLEEVGPLLAAADTVVLPSRWEGLPLGLLEAMARGRPVVASAVGGIPEVIEEGVNGRLVPAGDPVALADALEMLHRKPDAALRMGRRAAASVRESYTWERVVEGFEGVYDEVLGFASFAPDPQPRRPGRGARR